MKETLLLLEGVGPDEISETFLVRVMDVAKECELDLGGISVMRE